MAASPEGMQMFACQLARQFTRQYLTWFGQPHLAGHHHRHSLLAVSACPPHLLADDPVGGGDSHVHHQPDVGDVEPHAGAAGGHQHSRPEARDEGKEETNPSTSRNRPITRSFSSLVLLPDSLRTVSGVKVAR